MDEKIIEKQPVTLQELAKQLGEIKKKEMTPIQQKVHDFAKRFSKITPANAAKLKEDFKKLDITRLTDDHIADMINIMPQDLSELKTIFVKTNTTLPPEDFKRISELINKYRKAK
jgi:DNA-directed RNA polymerase subunit F